MIAPLGVKPRSSWPQPRWKIVKYGSWVDCHECIIAEPPAESNTGSWRMQRGITRKLLLLAVAETHVRQHGAGPTRQIPGPFAHHPQ